MLSSVELQMLENLQRKQILSLQQNPPAPAQNTPQTLDLAGLQGLIDQRVSERLQAMQIASAAQAAQAQPIQIRQPAQTPQPTPEPPDMLTLKSQQTQIL